MAGMPSRQRRSQHERRAVRNRSFLACCRIPAERPGISASLSFFPRNSRSLSWFVDGPFRHKRLRLPAQKIGNQSQSELLAFFGVKLGARDIVAADDGGHRTTVVGFRDDG